MTTFVDSFNPEKPDYLEALEREALETNVPIIRPQMQSFMKTLLTMSRPKCILEVGCAIGFSALWMRECSEAEITTIEKYEKRIPIAKANFEKYDPDHRITLLEGDALEILPTLEGPYDLIFMDAAKGQYLNFLPEILRLLALGGILLSDNVLQDGDIIESRFAITRRDRTIHSRMREYLYTLTHHEDLQTSILTVADGATISIKRF
jgi:predicted O-methyltransferase YrrM